jgi:WD40 repeat protein
MTRYALILACAVACSAAAAPALASGPAGSLTQLPGTAGCITDDGSSNGVASQCADGRGLISDEPIVVSPDGRFVYSYGQNTGAIAILSRNPATGVLTQSNDTTACISGPTLAECTDARFPSDGSDTAHSVALSPDGAFLFATGLGPPMVASFQRNATSGALTPVSGLAGCVSKDGKDADTAVTCTTYSLLDRQQSLAVSPDGRFVYAGGVGVSHGLVILTVGPTGGLGLMSAPDGCFTDGSTDADCTHARYSDEIYDLALSPDGRHLYGLGKTSSSVLAFARDAGTGRLTPIAGTGGCVYEGGPGPVLSEPCSAGHGLTDPNSVTVSPDGTLVVVGTYNDNGIAVLRRDPATGNLSQSAGAAGCVNLAGSDGCGKVRTTRTTYQTLFAPDSRTLFAAAWGNTEPNQSGVSVFDVGADGALTQRAGAAGCYSASGVDSNGTAGGCTAARGILGPIGLALSSDDKYMYIGSYDDGGAATFIYEAAPVCAGTSASTAFGTAVAIPVTCTDNNGDAIVLSGASAAGHGSLSFSGLTATYTPAAGFSGDDAFKVKANDGVNDSAPATVTVHVGAAPPPPVGTAKKTPAKLSLGAKPKRDRKLPYKFTFSGKLTPAAGATCSGKVTLTVKHGKKTVAKKTATLSSSCKWKAVVTFKNRKKLGKKKTGKLSAKARFGGNAALNAKASNAVTVRYG